MITHQPPEAERILWSLRRRRTDVRCLLCPELRPLEVHVFQDEDRIFIERFPSEDMALEWARQYELRLRATGWSDSPAVESA